MEAQISVFQEEGIRQNPPLLSIITCHPSSAEIPTLKNSFVGSVGMRDTEIVCCVGANSIAEAYNSAAKMSRGKFLIFTHSDVEILSPRAILNQLIQNLNIKNIGVVGIAGTKVLRENCIWWAQRDQLSGACMHANGNQIWMTAFGHYSHVVCLDGVFMSCHRQIWEELQFDETIPGWDFYDVDFTLRAYLKGYINATFPVMVLHKSIGDTSNKPGWHSNKKLMQEKWVKELPVTVEGRNVSTEFKTAPDSQGVGSSERRSEDPAGSSSGLDGQRSEAPSGIPDGRSEQNQPESGVAVG